MTKVEREYSTRLIDAAEPHDFTLICEMIARQILRDTQLTKKGDNNNDKQ